MLEALDGCEAILHGGDINRQEIIDELEKIAPVYVVRGNNDKDWVEHDRNVGAEDWKFLM